MSAVTATALTVTQDIDKALQTIGMDPTGLTPEEKAQLLAAYQSEFEASREGIELRPPQVKISKDTCTFMDSFGNALKELRGVVLLSQRIRGYWPKTGGDGNKAPQCASLDCVTGVERDTQQRISCARCPHAAWGSEVKPDGTSGKGQACKEKRRVFIVQGDAEVPVLLVVPTSSIREYDEFISARLARKIPNTAAETIFRLHPETSGDGFKYAKLSCEIGDKVPPREILRLAKLRQSMAEWAGRMAVGAEDADEDVDTGTAVNAAAAAADPNDPWK